MKELVGIYSESLHSIIAVCLKSTCGIIAKTNGAAQIEYIKI